MRRADSDSSHLTQEKAFHELLDEARAGSPEAFGCLFNRCRRYLTLIADRQLPLHLRARESPSDIVQDTFVDAQAGFPAFRGRTEHEFYGWLRQILLHRAFKLHRRYLGTEKRDPAREQSGGLDDGDSWQHHAQRCVTTPSAYAFANEKHWQICQALDQLTADYRQVILLHHRDGLDFKVVAQRMARSESAVRKLWARAIKQLQQRLEEMDATS